MIAMYATEALCIALIALWLLTRRLEPLLLAVLAGVATSTLHITYLLARLYERIEDFLAQSRSRYR